MTQIVCCSDFHGYYPDVGSGDILIFCGDVSRRDLLDEYNKFDEWLLKQEFEHKIVVAGNHDNKLFDVSYKIKNAHYLCDSGVEILNFNIFGSPWTLTFPGINPRCTAFTGTEEDLKAKFDLIPDDIDILITHGPPYGILDQVYHPENCRYHHTGSKSLMDAIKRVEPKVSIFGHIHEEYGSREAFALETDFFNCSHVNERYEPVNKPIRIVL